MSVARAVGGVFLLVQCGLYADDHPWAGQPALAIQHIVCCRVDQQDKPGLVAAAPTAELPTIPIPSVMKTKKKRKQTVLLPPQLLPDLVDGAPNQYYVAGAFMLTRDGWPTGKEALWLQQLCQQLLLLGCEG